MKIPRHLAVILIFVAAAPSGAEHRPWVFHLQGPALSGCRVLSSDQDIVSFLDFLQASGVTVLGYKTPNIRWSDNRAALAIITAGKDEPDDVGIGRFKVADGVGKFKEIRRLVVTSRETTDGQPKLFVIEWDSREWDSKMEKSQKGQCVYESIALQRRACLSSGASTCFPALEK
jgi:hypothetical protein